MEAIFTLENLYRAYLKCQRGKKNSINALKFELDREKNLVSLLNDLRTRKYEVSRHMYFIVTKPTPREIFAADFRDRIVHHLLCNEIQSIFESDFIEHSYANRVGKGTHKAVAQVRKFIRDIQKENCREIYYLKLDIESFFSSIDRAKLFAIIEEKLNRHRASALWQEEVLWLIRKILFHDVTANFLYKGSPEMKKLIPHHKSLFSKASGKGLPIGNLTSQFFANVYLNQFDQYVTRTLRVKRYVRYVDDFVCLSTDRQTLKSYSRPMDKFLQAELGLRLHPQKRHLQKVVKGIDFLGYVVKKSHLLVRQKIIKRFKLRLDEQRKDLVVGENDSKVELIKKIRQITDSYLGHLSHANSYRVGQNFRKKILEVTYIMASKRLL